MLPLYYTSQGRAISKVPSVERRFMKLYITWQMAFLINQLIKLPILDVMLDPPQAPRPVRRLLHKDQLYLFLSKALHLLLLLQNTYAARRVLNILMPTPHSIFRASMPHDNNSRRLSPGSRAIGAAAGIPQRQRCLTRVNQ